jgi:hypothetical protein
MTRVVLRILFFGGRRGFGVGLGLLVALGTALYVPAALAFPHHARIGNTTVYADAPISPEMADRIARANRLLGASPLHEPALERTLVLTDGGWRWRVMAVGSTDAIALRRPFAAVLVFNRTDIRADRVRNTAPIAGERTLSGTIAHETVHVLTARRYGEIALARLPVWKREGYADYVAQETSLGPDDEARVRARWPNAPVLAYYDGRRRVAAELARNGGSVDALFAR